jgi:hypothetical protein
MDTALIEVNFTKAGPLNLENKNKHPRRRLLCYKT